MKPSRIKRTDILVEDLIEIYDGIRGVRITVKGEKVFEGHRNDFSVYDLQKIAEKLGNSIAFTTPAKR